LIVFDLYWKIAGFAFSDWSNIFQRFTNQPWRMISNFRDDAQILTSRSIMLKSYALPKRNSTKVLFLTSLRISSLVSVKLQEYDSRNRVFSSFIKRVKLYKAIKRSSKFAQNLSGDSVNYTQEPFLARNMWVLDNSGHKYDYSKFPEHSNFRVLKLRGKSAICKDLLEYA